MTDFEAMEIAGGRCAGKKVACEFCAMVLELDLKAAQKWLCYF